MSPAYKPPARPTKPKPTMVYHELADIVPRMSDDEFRDLVKSMRADGQLDAITLYEGKILDGRHRYEACLLIGLEPRFEDYSGINPAGFVLGKITRRNLDESRRGLIAARILAKQADKPAGERLRNEDVRKIAGVGETVVVEAVRVIKNGVPELVKMIENGDIKVKQAAEITRLPKAEQQKVIAAGPKSVAAKSTQMRKERQAAVPAKPKSAAGKAADPEFSGLLGETIRDLTALTAKITKLIQTSDGKRFQEYVATLGLGWIDFSEVRKTEDTREGVKRGHAVFTAFRAVRRLLAASHRDRVYPAAQLRRMLDDAEPGVLDADRPPADEPTAPARSDVPMVEPESL